MTDGEQGTVEQQPDAQVQEQAPGWVAAGSAEAEYEDRLSAVVERFPELGQEEHARAALQTAHHLAAEHGDPTLAQHPTTIEAAHIANLHSAAQAEAAQAYEHAQPTAQDLADEFTQRVIHRGRGGSSVLPWGN